ncbi:MAG: IS5 family transposase [Candidatus Binatia bacterium]
MRGEVERQRTMLSVVSAEHRIPADHPLRRIKALADAELARLSPVFERMYAERGRPSVPPERLLKACLLIALYSIRSERQLCEQLQYNLLFQWFLDLDLHTVPFDASTIAKNKERLLRADVARRFFEGVVQQAKAAHLLSAEHFTVDGTLIEAWASLKSFRPKGERAEDRPPPDDPGNPTVNFHGERRSNATHASITDSDALLARKGNGKEAKLAFAGHVLMENRHGLCVDILVTRATGTAEREAALTMVRRQRRNGIRPRTLGADKAYDTAAFVAGLRAEGITPHVAPNITTRRDSTLDWRTLRHAGYQLSQRCRKKVEEIFGWGKTIGGLRKTRYRGVQRTGFWAYLVGAAYDLLRMAKLMPEIAVA